MNQSPIALYGQITGPEKLPNDLRDSEWGKEIYHITGVPIHAMSPLCKLIWLKENDPATFKTAYKFISIKEYIFSRLFDEYIIDTSIASATGLLNLKTLNWDEKILNFLDITPFFITGCFCQINPHL